MGKDESFQQKQQAPKAEQSQHSLPKSKQESPTILYATRTTPEVPTVQLGEYYTQKKFARLRDYDQINNRTHRGYAMWVTFNRRKWSTV